MNDQAPIPFWKMTGSGNDFVVVDNRRRIVPDSELGTFARAVCRRRYSVGADGVVFIEENSEENSPIDGHQIDFAWRYVNANGSEGAFCGNGAMCGARFAVLNQIAPHRCAFQTPAGIVHATVDNAKPHVQLALESPGPVQPLREITIGGHAVSLVPILVGVPHAVLLSNEDSFGSDFPALGRAIRHHEVFAPGGTNVNLVQIHDRHNLGMRTYERGVEEETLACGSGAIASAIVATARNLTAPPVAVITTGGPSLHIDFTWNATSSQATDLSLSGEACLVAKGKLSPEAF